MEPKKFKRKGERTLYTRDNPDRTARTAKPKTSAPSPSKRKKITGRLTSDNTQDGRTVKITPAQWLLGQHLQELGMEFWFEVMIEDHGRKWRFDIADVNTALAIECNGGKWHGGHRRGDAIEDENEKLNTAAMHGWKVLQFTNETILDGRAKAFLEVETRAGRIQCSKHRMRP